MYWQNYCLTSDIPINTEEMISKDTSVLAELLLVPSDILINTEEMISDDTSVLA